MVQFTAVAEFKTLSLGFKSQENAYKQLTQQTDTSTGKNKDI